MVSGRKLRASVKEESVPLIETQVDFLNEFMASYTNKPLKPPPVFRRTVDFAKLRFSRDSNPWQSLDAERNSTAKKSAGRRPMGVSLDARAKLLLREADESEMGVVS